MLDLDIHGTESAAGWRHSNALMSAPENFLSVPVETSMMADRSPELVGGFSNHPLGLRLHAEGVADVHARDRECEARIRRGRTLKILFRV